MDSKLCPRYVVAVVGDLVVEQVQDSSLYVTYN